MEISRSTSGVYLPSCFEKVSEAKFFGENFFEFWSFQPFLINRRVLNSSIFDIFFASNRNLLSNLGVLTINCHLSIDPIFSKFGMLAHF